MDSRWLKEDRDLPKSEQPEAIEATQKALKNSTLITRRLTNILDAMIEECNRDDEDFTKTDWVTEAVANASRRKTLKDIKKLVTFK